jgi:hypothetical protein
MSEIVYGRIDEYLRNELSEYNLYIQEGSGGYYIASRKENALNGSAFVDRFAQIVEDGEEYNLSLKDKKTGQWEEYKVFPTLDDCLAALSGSLKNTSEELISSETDQNAITEVNFNCWSCGGGLLKISGNGSQLSVDWAEGLDNIEMTCPKCKKVMLFNLNNEKDRTSILSPSAGVVYFHHLRSGGMASAAQNTSFNYQPGKKIRIDFYDLLWRLKDHTNTYSHYLNLLTGEIERLDSNALGVVRDDIFKFARYPWRKIPPISSREAYSVMEDFIKEMDSEEVKIQLENSILGPKPFKSFKMIIQEFPEMNERWVKSENEFYLNKSREWLDSIGLDYEMVL